MGNGKSPETKCTLFFLEPCVCVCVCVCVCKYISITKKENKRVKMELDRTPEYLRLP